MMIDLSLVGYGCFRSWQWDGITAICTFIKDVKLGSFEELKKGHDWKKTLRKPSYSLETKRKFGDNSSHRKSLPASGSQTMKLDYARDSLDRQGRYLGLLNQVGSVHGRGNSAEKKISRRSGNSAEVFIYNK